MSSKTKCLQQLMSSHSFTHLCIQKIYFKNLTGTVVGLREKRKITFDFGIMKCRKGTWVTIGGSDK